MEKEELLKTIKEILTKFPKEIYFITAEYDGVGDSGDFNDIIYKDKDQRYIPPSVIGNCDNQENNLIHKLYDLLEIDYGGWELELGSCGTFNIDVKNKIIQHTHNERYENYTTTENNYNIRHP